MSEPGAPEGPDLAAGVEESALREGAPLLGRVGEESVFLARVGGELFAVGATCTHYSGPLAEGLLVGDEVRCPWHHACFSLRTGAALRAPALDPIPCFRVERRDGRVFVREKLAPPAPPPSPAGGRGPTSVVIAGGGAAGNAAAEMLRRAGYAGPITMIGAEEGTPVDRPNLSKDYLAGGAPEEWIRLRDDAFYRERSIDRIAARVEAIDAGTRAVTLSGGRRIPFGALLLATGAVPNRLPIPGADGPRVHVLRSVDDSRRIIGAAKGGATSAVVIGASFIGLEVAASLRARGLAVDVVAPEAQPLARVLGDELSRMVRAIHEEHGVRFHLGRKPLAIDGGAVALDDGTRIAGDFVVMGIGVKPATELAETAGCKVDRGVIVDSRLETSVPGIFAAGDVARWPDARTGERVRIEHWVVAERMGQHAARAMLGSDAPFRDVPFFWSRHFDVSIGYSGHAERWDTVLIAGSPERRDCLVGYRAGKRILAVASVSRDLDSLRAEAALERGDDGALEALFRSR